MNNEASPAPPVAPQPAPEAHFVTFCAFTYQEDVIERLKIRCGSVVGALWYLGSSMNVFPEIENGTDNACIEENAAGKIVEPHHVSVGYSKIAPKA